MAGFLAECRTRGLSAEQFGDVVRIPVERAEQAKSFLLSPQVTDFEFRHGTMDDVFLNVTGGRSA